MKPHFDETEDELEVRRVRMLEDLRSGRVQLRPTPSREVAVMFQTLAEASEELFVKLGCVLLRAPADGKSPFILSDHPVTHYYPDRVGESPGFCRGRRAARSCRSTPPLRSCSSRTHPEPGAMSR